MNGAIVPLFGLRGRNNKAKDKNAALDQVPTQFPAPRRGARILCQPNTPPYLSTADYPPRSGLQNLPLLLNQPRNLQRHLQRRCPLLTSHCRLLLLLHTLHKRT